jgi:hypothetical protein
MILQDIKKHLTSRGPATAEQLSLALGADRELVVQAMEHWMRKKMVIEEKSGQHCCDSPCGACGCGSLHRPAAMYRWVSNN